MTQVRKDTLLEAVVLAKEWVAEKWAKKEGEVHIVQSMSEGNVRSASNKVCFYVEDENESGFTRNWESNIFNYSYDPYEPKGWPTRRYNKAIKQLTLLPLSLKA